MLEEASEPERRKRPTRTEPRRRGGLDQRRAEGAQRMPSCPNCTAVDLVDSVMAALEAPYPE
jgi:hypothetical protein